MPNFETYLGLISIRLMRLIACSSSMGGPLFLPKTERPPVPRHHLPKKLLPIPVWIIDPTTRSAPAAHNTCPLSQLRFVCSVTSCYRDRQDRIRFRPTSLSLSLFFFGSSCSTINTYSTIYHTTHTQPDPHPSIIITDRIPVCSLVSSVLVRSHISPPSP